MYLFGKPLPFFDGDDKGGGGADSNPDEGKPTGGGKGGATDKKEYTQEQLDKMFGDTRKQGRETLIKEILEKTGYKSVDEVYAAMDAHKKEQNEKLSEADRLKKEKSDLEAKNQNIEKDLRETRFERDFDRTVLKLELEFQNEKARDVAFKLLDIEKDGKDEKAIEEAIKGLVQDHAYLFADTEAEEIDATKRGKPNLKSLKKELVESKRRSGKYSTF